MEIFAPIVPINSSCQADPLLLSTGDVDTLFSNLGLVTSRKNFQVRSQGTCRHHLLIKLVENKTIRFEKKTGYENTLGPVLYPKVHVGGNTFWPTVVMIGQAYFWGNFMEAN